MSFDLICLALVALFGLVGVFRGLIRQVFGLAGFIGGIVLGRMFAAPLAETFHAQLGLSVSIAAVLFGFVIFFASALVARILGGLLHGALSGGITGALDRLGGLGLGLAKGALLAWALASLVSLAQPRMKDLEKRVPGLASLDLPHSQAMAMAKSQSSLGDQAKKMRADAEEQVRRGVRTTAAKRK